jgi:hypothetical protein
MAISDCEHLYQAPFQRVIDHHWAVARRCHEWNEDVIKYRNRDLSDLWEFQRFTGITTNDLYHKVPALQQNELR